MIHTYDYLRNKGGKRGGLGDKILRENFNKNKLFVINMIRLYKKIKRPRNSQIAHSVPEILK